MKIYLMAVALWLVGLSGSANAAGLNNGDGYFCENAGGVFLFSFYPNSEGELNAGKVRCSREGGNLKERVTGRRVS